MARDPRVLGSIAPWVIACPVIVHLGIVPRVIVRLAIAITTIEIMHEDD